MAKIPPNHLIPDDFNISDEMLKSLAKEYSTPLYVCQEESIRNRWRMLTEFLGERVTLYYSIKANPNPEIIDVCRELGASFEVASGGELKAVLSGRENGEKVIFVGPGKTISELELAIDNRVDLIVIESAIEAEKIQKICQSKKTHIDAALRVNPGKGNGMISMGGATQFGVDKQEAINILNGKGQYDRINFRGIHSYMGTGNLSGQAILEHTQMILATAEEIASNTNSCFDFIDIGGGLGIPYYDGDVPLDLESIKSNFHGLIENFLSRNPGIKEVAFEAGRFLAGPASVFLASVLDVKETENGVFIILDGGTNVFGGDNKYRGYKPLPMKLLNNKSDRSEIVSICGPLCTSADRLASDIMFPIPEIGDIIAFYQAGAYGLTASPGLFLSHGFPKEILVNNNGSVTVREYVCNGSSNTKKLKLV
jgi:diaminopimelate decarboxylase